MASPIPPLIPGPAKGTEEWIDRFATLFSPPTPRASPTNTLPPLHQFDSPRSPGTEIGAFVSLPPSQDPFAAVPFSRMHARAK
ncbi:hypothetical protein ARMGADRAFT_776329 [Armillaria gallica]|uniref:Uncharacterized protein n=1 Tax=Armillaria gallica TaxID=47427 RepID=A0A2H3CEM0_ARMGA|nr:hypothetical protein ARMGADRAFT_776329 [Armillaria gallica]